MTLDSEMTDILETVATSFRSWRTRRSTIAALSDLSDHALKDIGIGRNEIRSLAAELINETMPR